MKYGQIGNPHDVVHPQYGSWGLFGRKSLPARASEEIQASDIEEVIATITPWVNLEGYVPRYANRVPYYSLDAQTNPAILIRFEREDGQNIGLDHEHISVVYDPEKHSLLGFTRMQQGMDRGADFISHQAALNAAIAFLKTCASDLTPPDTSIPELVELRRDERMEFVPELPIGSHVELHWMDDHVEKIMGDTVETHGMKIKMSIPAQDLWAWVVVDKNGQIQTFEKNICWDFDKMERKTPMWLHDKWLIEQNFELQPIAPKPAKSCAF